MAFFLKTVSGLYLFLVWLIIAMAISRPVSPLAGTVGSGEAASVIVLFVGIVFSIPAAVLFGFAQIVDDVRTMRKLAKSQNDQLTAMRRYYEPNAR